MAERPPEWAPGEAEAAAALFSLKADVEGCWTAVCDGCGQVCGVSLLDPTADDRRYVVCPECGRTGRDGGVGWVEVADG